MTKNKKILLTIFAIMTFAPMVIGPLMMLFGDGEAEKKDKKAAVEQQVEVKQTTFNAPYNAVYMVSQAPDLDNYHVYYLRLSNKGVAELEHRNKHYFDYYTYEAQGNRIYLKGECRFMPNAYNRKKLSQHKPQDLVLKVVDDDSDVIFQAVNPDGKTVHQLIKPNSTAFSYFNPVYFSGYQALMKKDPTHLWVAKDNGGAYEDRGDEMVMRHSFKKGDILTLNEEKSTDTQLAMEFPGNKTFYVDRREVLHLGTTDRVLSVLYMEAECLENLLRFDSKIEKMAHHEVVKGYFNGWKAGKQSIYVFPVLMMVMVVLLLGSYLEFESLILNQGVAIFTTVFTFWYFATLGKDSFWTFNELTNMDWFISLVTTILFVVVLSIFLLQTTSHLREINEVDGKVSGWIEYGLLFPAAWVGTYAFVTDWPFMVQLPIWYLAFVLGSLPSAILYERRSNKTVSMMWYLCLAKPMSYLAILVITIAMVCMFVYAHLLKLQMAADAAAGEHHSEDWHDYVGPDGKHVSLYKDKNGSLVDHSGNIYHNAGGNARSSDGEFFEKS